LVAPYCLLEEQSGQPFVVCQLELPAGQAKFSLLKAAKLVKDNKPVLIIARCQGKSAT